jgi:integrase/recombinase XerD
MVPVLIGASSMSLDLKSLGGLRGTIRRSDCLHSQLPSLTGHRTDMQGALFRPVNNNRTGRLDRHLDPASVYRNIVRKYGLETGISAEVNGLCVHSQRATAATNALSHDSDIAKVQEWLGHANVSATRLYDRRKSKPEDSPTFRVKY